MEQIELTNMCMVLDEETGKVLVQNRIKGSWIGIAFPGGHVEPNESIVDSVIREIKEETGLTIDNVSLCGIKDWCVGKKRGVVMLFKTSSYEGVKLDSTDEGDVFWVSLEELKDLNLASGFDVMLQVFLNDHLNEHFIDFNQHSNAWEHILK